MGTRAQRHPGYSTPTRDCGERRTQDSLGPAREPVKVVSVGSGAPWAWRAGRKWRPSPGGGQSLAGQVGRTPQTQPRHYNAATSPYRRPGMATQTKTPTPRAGRAPPPTETCKQQELVFFSHRIPRRGTGQEVAEEVVFFFFFHENLSQQHFSPTRGHFRESKWSPKGKVPLAGRASSRTWKPSHHQ